MAKSASPIIPVVSKSGKSRHLWVLVLLSAITFAVYANTIKNGYVLDDMMMIKHDTLVTKGVSAVPRIFATPYLYGSINALNDHYKPLSLAMFAVEYQVADGAPALSHFVNVILFVFSVLLLFYFLDGLFRRERTQVAFIASLLFALHPISTEVVANIKSRDQLLCFLFGFLALNIFIRYADSGKTKLLIAGAFAFFLSLLSKETTITFLAVIPLVFFFYRDEHKRRSIYITASSVITVVLYLTIRHYIFQSYHISNHSVYNLMENALAHAPSVSSRFATAFLILGKYIKLLFVPYPLICDYSYSHIRFVTFSDFWVLLSIVFYSFILFYGLYRFWKNRKDLLAFCILFFLFTLSICSNIFILIGATMAERFLFFPIVGFCLAAAFFIERIAASQNGLLKDKKVRAAIIALGIVYAVLTIKRNGEWQDNLTLYTEDVSNAPENARLHLFLGSEYFQQSELAENINEKKELAYKGLESLKRSLALCPVYGDTHKALANAYYVIGLPDSAEAHYKHAIALKGNDVDAVHNLAGIYFNGQKYRQALDLCKKVLVLDKTYKRGYQYLALCYMHLGQHDSAISILKTAVVIDPAFGTTYENLALAYKLKGALDSARKYQNIARQYNPGFIVMPD